MRSPTACGEVKSKGVPATGRISPVGIATSSTWQGGGGWKASQEERRSRDHSAQSALPVAARCLARQRAKGLSAGPVTPPKHTQLDAWMLPSDMLAGLAGLPTRKRMQRSAFSPPSSSAPACSGRRGW